MVGHRTSGIPNVRGSVGRLRLNSRTGSALTRGRQDRGGRPSSRAGLAKAARAPQGALADAKGALDTAENDNDVQEGAEQTLTGAGRSGVKRTAAATKKATGTIRGGRGAGRLTPKTSMRKDGATLTGGRAAPSSRAAATSRAGRGSLSRGGSTSAKGGLMAAKNRAAKRRIAQLAKKRAKKAGAATGLPTSPLAAMRGGARGASHAARGAQLAMHVARAAAATVRNVIAAISAVTSTPVLIVVIVVIVVLALILTILAVLPGAGDEAQKQEAAICDTGGAPVNANVDNLPLSAAGYGPEQLANAAIIMKVAQDSGLDRRAQLIGLITAMQESDLGRDKTSLVPNSDGDAGLFQQRTYNGWYGSLEMINDPAYAANAFYNGVTATESGGWGSVGGGTGFGHLPGLKDVPNWQALSPTLAASAVQKPDEDYRYEYAKHEQKANELLNALGGTSVELGTGGSVAGCGIGVGGEATGTVKAVIDYAMSWQGKGLVYVLGGGNLDGPTGNSMDCSSFVGSAWKKGAGITFGRSAQDQWNNLAAYRVSTDELQPGDLLFEAAGRRGAVGSSDAVSHVGMYIGNGQMVEWGRSANGFHVGSVEGRINGPAFVGAARPPAPQTAEGDAS